MRKTVTLALAALFCVALVACKKKPAEEKGEAKAAMEAVDTDGEDKDPKDKDPGEDKDAKEKDPGEDKDAKASEEALAQCKKMYADHYAKFVPVLAKLGIEATAEEIVSAYQADKPDRLQRCMDLTPEQRDCAMKQPNPLLSRKECKHDKHLTMYVPSEWMKKIDGEVEPLEEKEAKALQAWLAGTWVNEDPRFKRREVLTIDKAGKATGERFKDGQPDDKKEEYEFSFKHPLRIHRLWGTTTQTFTFFKFGPKALVMSSNLIYNVMPLENKKTFTIKVGTHEVALVKDGECEVIDLSSAAAYPGTCTWGKDEKEKKETFEVSYKPEQFERKTLYFYVDKHLIHQFLWQSRYQKK